jgi:hypothetical protein
MTENALSLKEFIQGALEQICEAIEGAREKRDYIAPQVDDGHDKGRSSLIGFDIGVVVSGQDDKKFVVCADVGAKVLGIGAKVEGEHTEAAQNSRRYEHRVTFNVPVYFRHAKEMQKNSN